MSRFLRRKVYDAHFTSNTCFGEHLKKCGKLTSLECKIKFYQIIWARKFSSSFESVLIRPKYEPPKFLKDIPKVLCFLLGGENFDGIPCRDNRYYYGFGESKQNSYFWARHRIYTNRESERHIVRAHSTSYSHIDEKKDWTIPTLNIDASIEFSIEQRYRGYWQNFETLSEGILF